MYPVSNAFLEAVKANTRKYYWTGRITTIAGTVKKQSRWITDTHVSSLPFEIIVEKSRGINSSKICDNKGINITNAGNAISKNKDSCNDFARLGVVSYDSERDKTTPLKIFGGNRYDHTWSYNNGRIFDRRRYCYACTLRSREFIPRLRYKSC